MRRSPADAPRRHPSIATRSGLVAILALALVIASGCTDDAGDTTAPTTTTVAITTTTTTTIPVSTTAVDAPALLRDEDRLLDPDPMAVRQRAVRIRKDVLLDGDRAREVERITLNLFPDTTYVGLITRIDPYSGGYTWVGTLEGFEVSAVTIVWVGGVFAANIGSPEGVYEIAWSGSGGYRVYEIDQGAYPGEG